MTYLPLTNNPEATFNVVIFDNLYTFRQLWNEYGFWTLDISNTDGDILILGVKVITKINLLRQYPGFGFKLISENESDPGRYDLESFDLGVLSV